MTLTIRKLTLDDRPFLWEMLYQALYVPIGEPPLSRDIIHHPDIACYVEGWGRSGDFGFLAMMNDQPIGAVWLRLMMTAGYGYTDDETPELAIAILPDFRGQGVGTALLKTLVTDDRSPASISLSVAEVNPAVRLYERFGFAIVARKTGSVTMRRSFCDKVIANPL
jgi:GNAT superfamily N-acetyltransferase